MTGPADYIALRAALYSDGSEPICEQASFWIRDHALSWIQQSPATGFNVARRMGIIVDRRLGVIVYSGAVIKGAGDITVTGLSAMGLDP